MENLINIVLLLNIVLYFIFAIVLTLTDRKMKKEIDEINEINELMREYYRQRIEELAEIREDE